MTNAQRRSFTLIELLVVLALVAILSVVVVITLNPAELIKQARDSNRLSDLSTINTALNLFSTDVTSGFMGTSTIVYVSIPDNASSTCGSLGLPTLPSGYTYKCATTQTLRNIDGTGWIPVNFQRISSNSPISQLPIDPTNTTSTGNYYTYVAGGSWQLASRLESAKYILQNATVGTYDIGLYTTGNTSVAIPFVGGLVGYWSFEEGSGSTTSTDYSGSGKNGTWVGSGAHYTAGKVGSYAGLFNGTASGDHINFGVVYTKGWRQFSYGGWINTTATSGSQTIISESAGAANFILVMNRSTGGKLDAYMSTNGTNPGWQANVTGTVNDGNWHHIMVVYTGQNEIVYVDGIQTFSVVGTGVSLNTVTYFDIGASEDGSHIAGSFFNGKIDDLRLYSRALSAAEILALYNATK